ncbi:MAG: thioesterase [bacterium]|nr:thioesterase [bacterium]
MIGSTADVSLVVADDDTAVAYRSGDVPVLATPRVVALAEQAAVAAIEVEPSQTTVGIYIDIHHLKATSVGGAVTAGATVVAMEGRKISFEFTVTEGEATVAHGTHTRVVVDRDRFA